MQKGPATPAFVQFIVGTVAMARAKKIRLTKPASGEEKGRPLSAKKPGKLLETISLALQDANTRDISTVGRLLDLFGDLTGANAARPNFRAVSEGATELLSRIIMDAVPDAGQSLTNIRQAVAILAGHTGKGDLASFEGFSAELGLSATKPGSPASEGPVASPVVADAAILGEFVDQYRRSLEEMETFVLRMETDGDREALGRFRRILHTMKGESGFLGLGDITTVCHETENYLEEADPNFKFGTLLEVKDWLASAIADLAAGKAISRKPDSLLATLKVAPAEGESAPPAEAAAGPTPPAPPAVEGKVYPLTADASLLFDFVMESKEHLALANTDLLNLESDPANEDALNSVFRAFHTIKGIAGFLDLPEIQTLAHDAESLMDLARKGTLSLSHHVIDVIFEALDSMGNLIANVKTALEGDGTMAADPDLPGLLESIGAAATGEPGPTPPVEPSDQPLGALLVESGACTNEEVREAVAKEQAQPTGQKLGELLVKDERVAPIQVAEALRRQNAEQEPQASAPPPKTDGRGAAKMRESIRVDYERMESMVDTAGELVIAEAMITQDEEILKIRTESVGKKLHNLRVIARKLQELGTTIRMVPISGTFQKMARMVRDLARKSGKEVVFHTFGEETEMDRAYVDKIGDPLVHMIRNAVDHGIESPADRKKSGKPPAGKIQLAAFQEGGNIIVELRDDGKGIDQEAVRAKAIERGLIAEGDQISTQETCQLIVQAGFSTASKVTDVSGRGVGMDVVKRNIEELRGKVHIESEVGQGTVFRIVLPLTMALIDGMVVRVGKERFIFPVLSVVESLRPEAGMVHHLVGKREMISLRNKQLPLYRLSQLFQIPGARSEITEALVVIAESGGQQIGLLVDELVGLQQTVIKSLGMGFGQAEGVSGGAIMADGQVGLILDVPGIVHLTQKFYRDSEVES